MKTEFMKYQTLFDSIKSLIRGKEGKQGEGEEWVGEL
jgi:hypothetical protein